MVDDKDKKTNKESANKEEQFTIKDLISKFNSEKKSIRGSKNGKGLGS